MKFANETNFLRSQLFSGNAPSVASFPPHHNWFLSAAHTMEDIHKTLEVADKGFRMVKERFGG